jgi:hypothetical protein
VVDSPSYTRVTAPLLADPDVCVGGLELNVPLVVAEYLLPFQIMYAGAVTDPPDDHTVPPVDVLTRGEITPREGGVRTSITGDTY